MEFLRRMKFARGTHENSCDIRKCNVKNAEQKIKNISESWFNNFCLWLVSEKFSLRRALSPNFISTLSKIWTLKGPILTHSKSFECMSPNASFSSRGCRTEVLLQLARRNFHPHALRSHVNKKNSIKPG